MWKAKPDSRRDAYLFWGGVLIGAGLFNFVEGIVNHHLLEIHHVKPGPQQLAYDILYDLSGLALIAIGWLIKRRYPLRLPQNAT